MTAELAPTVSPRFQSSHSNHGTAIPGRLVLERLDERAQRLKFAELEATNSCGTGKDGRLAIHFLPILSAISARVGFR